MKTKIIILVVLSILATFDHCLAQQPTSRQLLNDAITAIGSIDGWQTDVLGNNLKHIIDNYPSSAEVNTAKALRVSYLMQQGGNENYTEALALANTLLSNPQGWQAAWAAVDKAALLGFLDKPAESLQAAKDGLAIVQAAGIDQVSDPDFVRLVNITGAKRTDLKDGLLSIIATHLVEQGSIAEADSYISQIVDAKRRTKVQRLRDRKSL